MDDDARRLAFALEKYPQRVEVAPIGRLVMESARQNAKRPAYLKLAVPDEVVKALRGRREAQDDYLLVRIPREVRERSESRIVLPGEIEPEVR
ncbi:MAG: hypothetical protein R3325_12435 [Thermoanaerobaculia bacterium]|nr:hypothetical protein [Thermoanaerobaculia bacterium]